MNPRWLSPSRFGIAGRLLLWFLVIALIPCGILTAITGSISRRSLESSIRQRLMVLSDAKNTQLENFVEERRGDVAILGQNPGVIQAVTRLDQLRKEGKRDTPDYRGEADKYRPNLTSYVDVYGYENAFLFDLEGNLLLAQAPALDPGANV